MSFIDTIKEMGSIAIITIVFGVFLSVLIKNLPNHFGNQNYSMFFNLLIVLAGLQLFTIIYIGAKPYTNLYRDPDGDVPLQDNKNFFYYWWDWMYPGYGTKGVELDVFMYIAYLMIIIIIILVVLNKVNNSGDFDSQDFKNPVALGICFLEDNGYNIFLFGNIFMFMYISRFVIKGLNLLGSKEISCATGNIKTCFSEDEVDTYSNIIECNNKMEPAKCPPSGRDSITLPGCPTVYNEYLKSVFDYKLPLIIKKEGTSFKLKQDDDNPSYSELPTKCKSSIDTFLKEFKSDSFPSDKCGNPDTKFSNADVKQCEGHEDQPGEEVGKGISYSFADGTQCAGKVCKFSECCKSPTNQDCPGSIYKDDTGCSHSSGGNDYVTSTNPPEKCIGHVCTVSECCSARASCGMFKENCPAGTQKQAMDKTCARDVCTPYECCQSGTCSPAETQSPDGAVTDPSSCSIATSVEACGDGCEWTPFPTPTPLPETRGRCVPSESNPLPLGSCTGNDEEACPSEGCKWDS